jgi:ABC-type uncharacterized transport system involved in gliding motility auxiliary subunit
MRGGRILVLHERYSVDLGQFAGERIQTGLDPLLERWGLKIPDDVLVIDRACARVPVRQKSPIGMVQTLFDYVYIPSLSDQTGGFSEKHPITKGLRRRELRLFWVSPIDLLPDRPASIEVENLLSSSELAYRTKEVEHLRPDASTSERALSKVASRDRARQRLAVALVGKFPSLFAGKPVPEPAESRPAHLPPPKVADNDRTVIAESQETRVVVVGDADLARNELLGSDESAAIFLGNTIDWLALDQDLISIRSRGQVRPLRDFEIEVLREKGIEPGKTTTVSSEQEFRDLQATYEKGNLEAREIADRRRAWIKMANMTGPGVALLGVGLWRWGRRRRERSRASEAAAGGPA